jgi:hypothetical protein
MMEGGSLTLDEVKQRHKLYHKATTKEEKQLRRKHINWINKQIELDKKGINRDDNIWDWVKAELKKGDVIQTPKHLKTNNIDELQEEIRQLKDENLKLKEEIKQLKEPKKVTIKEKRPIIKGDVEYITINGIIYKKSVQPFRHTEKYYLWDKDKGHLVGIYNAITKRVNKTPKHLQHRQVIDKKLGGNIDDGYSSDDDNSDNDDNDNWMYKPITYGNGLDDYKVQSIIFDKTKFDERNALKWLIKHNFKNNGVDVKVNTLRYRQEDPKELKKDNFIFYHNKPLGDSGVTLVLVYKKTKNIKPVNNWIVYVREYANKKGISYSQALKDPTLKANYKKFWLII